MALQALAELAIGTRHGATENRHPVAPPGIQVVLALEIWKRDRAAVQGEVISIPRVGGLHHRYSRAA
jgi:hypothetical protein